MKNNSVNKRYVPKLRFKGFNEFWKITKIENEFFIKKGVQINKSLIHQNGKFYHLNGGLTYSNKCNKWNTKKNTISISEGGESCGYISWNDQKFWAGGHLYTLDVLNSQNNSKYLYYVLKKNEKLIMNLRVGSSIPNIQKKDLFSFKISISINNEEQIKISNFLSLLDKQISLLENKLKLTELKMKDFIKKSNVESSKLMIKDIAIVIDGFPFKQTSYVENGIPIYTISNIGDNKFIDTIEYKYTNIEIDSKYQLNKGDIFASLTGEKGFKSLLYQNENKNYINQRTIKIEIKNNYSPELLQFWCFKNKRKVSLLATGSQKNISKKDVENFLVPKCTKENINLSKIFFNYIENVQLIQNKLHMLNKRKKFYLNNLFI